MTNTGFDVFDRTVQKSILWIDEVNEELGRDDRQYGYMALRSVMHTLRDRLTVEEAADLSAQLPLMIQGIYFDGWTPADVPVTIREQDEFLDYINDKMGPQVNDLPPTEALKAVLTVLDKHVTQGEMEDIHKMLPEELKLLWKEAIPA